MALIVLLAGMDRAKGPEIPPQCPARELGVLLAAEPVFLAMLQRGIAHHPMTVSP
jgi:hypothetical protein